jgi:hypothetical protein
MTDGAARGCGPRLRDGYPISLTAGTSGAWRTVRLVLGCPSVSNATTAAIAFPPRSLLVPCGRLPKVV